MIYIDPTEARDSTRLPQSTINIAHLLQGLEYYTGADILITPHTSPMPDTITDIVPHQTALRTHCQDGVLIQRKSGADFLSSINDLALIQGRMLEWSDNPWLLITCVREGSKGSVLITGTKKRWQWNWSSLSGVMDAWCDRGGSVKMLRTDEDITQWLLAREKRCTLWQKEPIKHVNRIRQHISVDECNWFNTLRAWPGQVGPKMLEELAKYIVQQWNRPPTLANAIALACSDEVLGVKWWGPVTLDRVREWFGVNKSIPPRNLGLDSGCWVYNSDTADVSKATKVEVVVGKEQVIIDGQVYRVKKHPLGTVDDPNPIPDDVVVMEGK